ncbi:hypothetical protein ABIB89_003173 [Bradyrhizobium sp. JR3.12]
MTPRKLRLPNTKSAPPGLSYEAWQLLNRIESKRRGSLRLYARNLLIAAELTSKKYIRVMDDATFGIQLILTTKGVALINRYEPIPVDRPTF